MNAELNFQILVAEPKDYSSEACQVLSKIGKVILEEVSQGALPEKIRDVDVLIVRLGLKVDNKVIQSAKRLKYIVSATTGTDHIDLKAAQEQGIKVICLKGEEKFLQTIPSTAEHTWTLMLALLRKLPQAICHVQDGGWNRQLFRGNNLKGKRLGILGLGRVGKQVAGYALAFECETAAFDPFTKKWLPGVRRFDSAEVLMRWSEILCIHVPYDTSTHHLLNRSLLSCLQKGALLVNTSRGGVWDESAILEMLESGYLAGTATDVIENEMDPMQRQKSPMIAYARKHDNLLITPHIAGATFESMHVTEVFVAKKLVKQAQHDFTHYH